MAADWFVIISDEIRGPYTADQMRSAASNGVVKASTSVRKGTDGDWFRADQIQGLLPAKSEPSVAALPAASPVASDKVAQASPARPDTPPIPNIVAANSARSGLPRSGRSPNRRRSSPWPVIVVGVVAVGLLLGMLYVLSAGGSGSQGSKSERSVSKTH